jgi:hypothetical protein
MKGKRKMTQAAWFRVFGLAAMALMPGLAMAAQAGDPGAIEQRLNAEFKPTTISPDRLHIVMAGGRVVIQKPGLTMYGVDSPMPPLYTYKNGKIGRGLLGFGKDLEISIKTPGGTAADYPHRRFAPGEKCWVTDVQVQQDGVIFQLYSDAYDDTRYYADLKIPFPSKKEMPPADAVVQMVAEVLTAAPAEKPVSQPAAKTPAVPVVNPAPKSPPADLSGKYNFDEGDSQLNFVSSTGCIMIGPGGTQSAGKYKVNGDTLTMDCTVTGSSFNLKIQGDGLVAGNGHLWVRQAVAPPLPPSISIGQTKAQVTAAFGQPLKVSNQGVKEIFYYKDMKVTFTHGKVASVE